MSHAANVTARAVILALASRKIYRVTKECMNRNRAVPKTTYTDDAATVATSVTSYLQTGQSLE